MKRYRIIVLIVVTILMVALWSGWSYFLKPPEKEGKVCQVEIPSGAPLVQVAILLEEEGVIRRRWGFLLLAKLKGLEKKIKAGDYSFNTAMTPSEVLDKLVKGDCRVYKITIPEGYTVLQVAEILEKAALASKEKVLHYASDPHFVHSLGIEGNTLEGFLFPDTYFFTKNMGAERILRAMVNRFHAVFTEEYLRRAQELGMTQWEVVILASIVEKETACPEERPMVAAVFYNRLKLGMPLQSDPTVIYGIEDFDGNLTRETLERGTPFNTYQTRGLPPQPIANPGEKSIEAVLYPSTGDYLYFVSKNDGTHYFSRTLEEHNRAVQYYQRSRHSSLVH